MSCRLIKTRLRHLAWAVVLAMCALFCAEKSTAAPAADELASQVRALLSDRCFACHGPDSGKRQAGLRLDLGSEFIGDAADSIVVAGDPQASELVRRITTDDPALQMPPPDSNLSLDSSEKALLKKWIRSGAPWKEHWAFMPSKASSPPAASFPGWGRNPIDQFVGAKLADHGLRPAARAAKEILLRRVTFDLTGLPPTISELEAFVADDSEQAFERVVDRLLDSPRFGERMAVDWLDAARYSDTYGYQNDRFRRVWPWRDWVIQAINENLPYDQFITWQLAGDLLPAPSRQQQLATTFCRLHRETNEGGSLPAEFRVENVADRTNTLGAAVLGLTLECARCHDHKFDPISQRDYYELFAYFNNTGELGLYSHYTDATPTPALDLPTEEQQSRLNELNEVVAAAERSVADRRERALNASGGEDHTPGAIQPKPVGEYDFDTIGPDERLVGDPDPIVGVEGSGLELSGENGWRGPRQAFDRWAPFSVAIWVRPTVENQDAVVVHRSQAWLDACGRGYQITLDQGRPAAALVHFWPGNAISRVASQPLPLGKWSHVAITYDGSSRAAGLKLYVDGALCDSQTPHDSLTRTIRYAPGDLASDDGVRLTVGHRFRDTGFRNGAVDELRVFDVQLTPLEVRRLAGQSLDAAPPEDVREHQLARGDRQYIQAVEQLAELRAQRDTLRDQIHSIAVMRDQPSPSDTHLLDRGAYDAPGERVEPRPLESIAGDVPAGAPNRLGLARWLTDPQHPLTSRVAVNRYWQAVFGRGLVTTANDFGSQGTPPSHPELLDWLARHFVDSGWDVKALVRLMVTSTTYQQDSSASVELLEIDPENQLLARGPSGRLSAEMIRDGALAAGDLLVESIGGPPVRPFQPHGLWEEKGAATYERQRGAGSHRRSVYTIWKRTSPPPAMVTFDASDRDVCVMRRQATDTPLQALVLLNDPQHVEAACGLAHRVQQQELPTLGERLTAMFRIALSRHPSKAELSVLKLLFDEQHAYFEEDPDAAAKLLSIGDLPDPDAATAVETAALATVAQALLNHDGAVVKR